MKHLKRLLFIIFICTAFLLFGKENKVYAATTNEDYACFFCGSASGGKYVWSKVSNLATKCTETGKSQADCNGITTYTPREGNEPSSSASENPKAITEYEPTTGPKIDIKTSDASCEGILGNGEFFSLVKELFGILRILAVAFVLVFSIIDFAKGLISQEQDLLKKAFQKSTKRLLVAAGFFFLPLILNLLLSILGGIGVICII